MSIIIKNSLPTIFLALSLIACSQSTPTKPSAGSTGATQNQSPKLPNIDNQVIIQPLDELGLGRDEEDNGLIVETIITENSPTNNAFNDNSSTTDTNHNIKILTEQSDIDIDEDTKIAVLLPLTGQLKSVGLNTQKGLIQKYFNVTQKPAKLSFYNSNTADINTLYYQLIERGYSTVIGPITTRQINKITYSTQITNIPLNPASTQSTQIKAFDFKEYNTHEISQIVDKLKQRQHQNILLILENNISGSTFADVLSSQWFNQGYNTDKILYLSKNLTQNAKLIRRYLTEQPKLKSYQYDENDELNTTTNIKDTFPFIRQDIDAIVISIDTDNARLITSLMKTIGGPQLPIYSSSLLAKSNDFKISNEKELNTIYYLDSPWKYTKKDANFLHSLSSDALHIALAHQAYPQFTYLGLTGDYAVSPQGMYRKQRWYQFQRSRAVPLADILN